MLEVLITILVILGVIALAPYILAFLAFCAAVLFGLAAAVAHFFSKKDPE